MVKFARSGGEANSIAIRIARAASKRDNVGICGYHGWHDWYLSVNLRSKKFEYPFITWFRNRWCTKITEKQCFCFLIIMILKL